MKSKNHKRLLFLLLTICLLLYPSVSADAAGKTTKKRASYSIRKYSAVYYGYKVQGKYLFELPVLKGNSKVVRKINNSLKKLYKKSFYNKKRLKEYTEQRDRNSYFSEYYETYNFETTCTVTYNKRGIVCFCFYEDWFAGGVHNSCHYGATYSLKTGKKLALYEVASGSPSAIKNKIGNKYAQIYKPQFTVAEMKRKVRSMKWTQFYFYLKNGKVVVSTGSYGPLGMNGEIPITIKGDY